MRLEHYAGFKTDNWKPLVFFPRVNEMSGSRRNLPVWKKLAYTVLFWVIMGVMIWLFMNFRLKESWMPFESR